VLVGAWSGLPTPRIQLSHGVGMLSEDRKGEGLAIDLPVSHNLTMSHLEGLGPGPFVLPGRMSGVARVWIERLGIRCSDPAQPVGELSGGNQQKVALARLLHHDVDVLVLDEPTRGIDVGSKAQIYSLMDALVATSAPRPRAVLLVSSYLPEIIGLCDRVAVMRRGRLGPARPVEGLTEHDLMMEATGAEDAA
jgi:ribose transport system ATP-binding protein